MPSFRKDRVGDEILSFLANEIHLLADPRLKLVTLTGVNISPDLKVAKLFWTIPGEDLLAAWQGDPFEVKRQIKSSGNSHGNFASEERVKQVERALRGATRLLKSKLGKELRLRYTPDLHFEYDQSIAHGFHIDRLLDQVKE